MNYRVIVAPEVFEALNDFIDYFAVTQQAPLNTERWLKKAFTALTSLKQFPHRSPPAPENESYEQSVRMLIVDRCLVLYWVDEQAKAVRVIGFRHGSQDTPAC